MIALEYIYIDVVDSCLWMFQLIHMVLVSFDVQEPYTGLVRYNAGDIARPYNDGVERGVWL